MSSQNSAYEHYDKGIELINQISKTGKKDPELLHETIQKLETALKIGLSEEDELRARSFLGQSYAMLVGDNIDTPFVPEYDKALQQIEKAVLIDSQGRYGYFTKFRSNLQRLDVIYNMRVLYLYSREGVDRAINYIEEKLPLFDYLSSTPLLKTVFDLGRMYIDKNQHEKACEYWQEVIDAEVVSDNPFERKVRQDAAQYLQNVQGLLKEQAKIQSENPRSVQIRYKIQGILYGSLTVFLFVSLISYHYYAENPVSLPGQGVFRNIAGIVGAIVAHLFFQYFGYIAYAFPLITLGIAIDNFRGTPRFVNYGNVIAVFLGLVCSCALLGLPFLGSIYTPGGIIGAVVASLLDNYLNSFGTIVVIATGLLTVGILFKKFLFQH